MSTIKIIIAITFCISAGYFAYQKVGKKEICEKKNSNVQNNQAVTNKPEENKDQNTKEKEKLKEEKEGKNSKINPEINQAKSEEPLEEQQPWFLSWKGAFIFGLIETVIIALISYWSFKNPEPAFGKVYIIILIFFHVVLPFILAAFIKNNKNYFNRLLSAFINDLKTIPAFIIIFIVWLIIITIATKEKYYCTHYISVVLLAVI